MKIVYVKREDTVYWLEPVLQAINRPSLHVTFFQPVNQCEKIAILISNSYSKDKNGKIFLKAGSSCW